MKAVVEAMRWITRIMLNSFLLFSLLEISSASGLSAETLKPGLVWVFFNDPGMRRPVDFGVDRKIDLDTGERIKDFAKIWLGRIVAPVRGEVTFHAEADNGLLLWVGGKLIIDGWSKNHRQGSFLFTEKNRPVPFQLYFFQNGGAARMRLFWSLSGRPRELIDASCFFYGEEEARRVRAISNLKGVRPAEEVPLSAEKARLYFPETAPPKSAPLPLKEGPYLFVDDFLIEKSTGVVREVNVPRRDPGIPNPIVMGKEDGCFQPYMTVLRDKSTGRFRLWYGCRREDRNPGASRIGYMESADGIHWIRPHKVLRDPGPIQFGVSVIDEGADFPYPHLRFKYAWWKDGGLKIAASADGLNWVPFAPSVVLPHNHDITSIFYDPLRRRYLATVSVYIKGPWRGRRRVTMQSWSHDLITWAVPHHVLVPDLKWDEGQTQFYAMDGFLVRGELIIGMVKVLRDDLRADQVPDPPNQHGIGYTCLAWTRDGVTWVWDRTPFFRRNPKKGTWDHAHAWIDEQVPVGDEVYLYYGGYARGHKVNRFEERQIGLVKIKRDRYVSRRATEKPGRLVTRALRVQCDYITLNVDSKGGEVRVEVLNDKYEPVPGFTLEDAFPIRSDSVRVPVKWSKPFSALRGKVIHLSFHLKNARLFAFDCRNKTASKVK